MTEDYVFERGVDADGAVIEVTGIPFYKEGRTGFADSVAAVQGARLQRAPTYMFALGRAHADRSNPLWNYWNDTNAEVDIVIDKLNILRNGAGKRYVVDFQLGGIFVNDHNRVRSAVTENKLCNGAMPLDQEEVNDLLGYIAKGDVSAIVQKGWLQGSEGANYAFKTVEEFIDASNAKIFLCNTPGYVVVTPVEQAQVELSRYKLISTLFDDPRLQIMSGGKAALEGMLYQAQSLGYKKFGLHIDDYQFANSGRAVFLGNNHFGTNGNYGLYRDGRSVGVTLEMLEKRKKIVR